MRGFRRTGLALALAALCACDSAPPRNYRPPDHPERGANIRPADIKYTQQQHAYYYAAGVEVIRCIVKHGSRCRHPAITAETGFSSSSGGDEISLFGNGPRGMAGAADLMRPYREFHYFRFDSMPVPRGPEQTYLVRLTLSSGSGPSQLDARLTFSGEKLIGLGLSPKYAISGPIH